MVKILLSVLKLLLMDQERRFLVSHRLLVWVDQEKVLVSIWVHLVWVDRLVKEVPEDRLV